MPQEVVYLKVTLPNERKLQPEKILSQNAARTIFTPLGCIRENK
jgi:hypothetical protein